MPQYDLKVGHDTDCYHDNCFVYFFQIFNLKIFTVMSFLNKQFVFNINVSTFLRH